MLHRALSPIGPKPVGGAGEDGSLSVSCHDDNKGCCAVTFTSDKSGAHRMARSKKDSIIRPWALLLTANDGGLTMIARQAAGRVRRRLRLVTPDEGHREQFS